MTPIPRTLLFLLSAICSTVPVVAGGNFVLSTSGSGRATAYLESPKIATFEGRTHVAWLDSTAEGFRIRIRTLDTKTGEWSPAVTVGEAEDNHGGPALVVDREGYLHIVFYSHHHPFRYRRSLRPNDASEWTPYEEFGTNLTYPSMVVAKDGSLVLAARRSYDDAPWELEMWRKPPGESWSRQGAVLRSRHTGYAQFAGSLAWGPDHTTLHLGTRIYETLADEQQSPLTTVGYLKSEDGGWHWTHADGIPVTLPATAESVDVIASGRGRESRILNAGSIGVAPDGTPFVPYSVRCDDASEAWLATPAGNGKWRHLHLNPFLPDTFRDWALFMHGGLAFGASGQPMLVATLMRLKPETVDWGEPTTEVVCFRSEDGGLSFTAEVLDHPDPLTPRWMPNIERPTGFNQMPPNPAFIYTDGSRGTSLSDVLSNRVIYHSDAGQGSATRAAGPAGSGR